MIATTATEIYKAYKDSLIGAFNEAYTAKCLNAANIESFTVNRPVSEYHYTLYYYDQAGNLIKTISPEGVHPNTNGTWLAQVKTKRANGERQVPEHTLPVVYRYNSLNQVVTQYSPDGGYSKFWYDRLGRLAISQNEKQLSANNYSYTLYDQLGRITEVGEKQQLTAMDNTTSRNQSSLQTWLNYTYTVNSQTILAQQVTRTVYDVVASLPTVSGTTAYTFHQKGYTLRNRVSNTLLYDVLPVSGGNPQYSEYSSGTYYSYDIHGNVDTLLNDYRLGLMASNGANRFKLTAYNYDLISGKVNEVHYQPGEKDQFYHRYEYDAENRITDVFTTNVKEFVSTRSNEDHEAFYQYYKHGPLARTVIGQQQVQGIDYAYTLQGWLKGVNSTALMPDRDMGEDEGTLTARDAYSFNLNYFTGDYNPIHDTRMPFPGHTAFMPTNEYKGLYNGNISSMAVNIRGFSPQLYNYHYDQLNRIVSMDTYRGLSQTNNDWSNLYQTADYKERVSYDPNGNILTYERNGTTAGGRPLTMDNLTYNYFTDGSGNKRNNRLRMVRDAISSANYTEDIDDQLSAVNNAADSNYVYDEIGNLIQDKSEKIDNIKWNVYGKIVEIEKTATDQNPVTKISYTYDAAGNRISKTVTKIPPSGGGGAETTWYVRDAQGNVLGVYTDKNSLTLTEHHIYGSSRLGIANRDLTIADPSISGTSLNLLGNSYLANFERGKKFFELTNHLGNVLVTVSDRKLQVTSSSQDGEENGGCEIGSAEDVLNISTRNGEATYVARMEVNLLPGFESNAGDDYAAYTDNSLTACVPYSEPTLPVQGWYYAADIVSASDYYPGGMLQPGRKFSSGSYRYGFNGKEMDNEVKGEGNQLNFGTRIYDPRAVTWYSTDPITKAWISPYQYASNNPVNLIDPDGGDEYHFHYRTIEVNVPTRVTGENGISKVVNQTGHVTVSWVEVLKDNNKDRFFVHRQGVPKPETIEFYPNTAEPTKTGVTSTSYLFNTITVKDHDYESLQKFADEFPDLRATTLAPEVGSANSNGSQHSQNRAWWSNFYSTLDAKKEHEKAESQRTTFALGVFGTVLPVEEIIVGAIGKFGTEAMIDISAIEKNFNRFKKAVPVNSKSSISAEVVEDGNILFSATSPGKVPGSSAVYQKLVNPKGETLKFIKTTYGPGDVLIHVKDKINGTVIQIPE